MDKSQNKLYRAGKKWVITAFAATTICTSGYTLFNSNVAYADNGQTVTTNGKYVEIASNAARDADSYAHVVSDINGKWQFCPGGDLLSDLSEQAIKDAYGASSASYKLSRSQMDENEQSLAASTAMSYAANASSVASIATISASSISNVASSMASSAQNKISIYKSYAESLNANIQKYSNDVINWNKNGDLLKSPLRLRVNTIKSLESRVVSNASIAKSNLYKLNSAADSVTDNIINKNYINSLDSGMTLVSKHGNYIGSFSQSSYDQIKSQASLAIQMTKTKDAASQIADSLNIKAKNGDDKSASAFAFNSALSAYDTVNSLYVKIYNEFNVIAEHAINTPYERNISLPETGDSFDNKLNLLRNIETELYTNNHFLNEAIQLDDDFYPNLNTTLVMAMVDIRYEKDLSSYFAKDIPIPSVISLEDNNMSMADSAYNSMNTAIQFTSSMASEFNSVKSSPKYKQIESYIATVASAADNINSYADNVSSIYTKLGSNNHSLEMLKERISMYANNMRTEASKIKQFGHMDTIENNSYNASYALSYAEMASSDALQANEIANSISESTSASSSTSTTTYTSTATSSATVSLSSNNSYISSLYDSNVIPSNNFVYKAPTVYSNSSDASSTSNSANYSVATITASSANSQSTFSSSYSVTSSSVTSVISNNASSANSISYKKLYQKVQKNLTKEIAINKSKVAKFKKAYQKTKNKRDKAKKLKAYQDAQYKLKLAQKHYRDINK